MGAASLARALALGLHAKPVVVAEECLMDGVRAAVRGAGLNILTMDHLMRLSPDINRSATVLSFPVDDAQAIHESARMLEALRPTAVVAVEKLGPNERGVYHMVKGHDSSAFQAKVGRLFEAARRHGVLTIGVGDRGNEIGMGAIADTVKRLLPYGAKCQCPCGGGVADASEVDVVVPGTCSNWGAYGISACLAALLDVPDILHDVTAEARMLRGCIDAGMADGISILCEPAVDGIAEEVHLALVTMLNAVVRTPVPGPNQSSRRRASVRGVLMTFRSEPDIELCGRNGEASLLHVWRVSHVRPEGLHAHGRYGHLGGGAHPDVPDRASRGLGRL
jgi:D-glutamate cyclase